MCFLQVSKVEIAIVMFNDVFLGGFFSYGNWQGMHVMHVLLFYWAVCTA